MDIHETRRRAAQARRLKEDADLKAVLAEIVEEAKAAFLASRGDPDALTAAYRKAEAVQTLLDALQASIDAQTFEDNREQRRARHD